MGLTVGIISYRDSVVVDVVHIKSYVDTLSLVNVCCLWFSVVVRCRAARPERKNFSTGRQDPG